MFKTGLAIGIAVAFFGFVTQPSIADDDDDNANKVHKVLIKILKQLKKQNGGGGRAKRNRERRERCIRVRGVHRSDHRRNPWWWRSYSVCDMPKRVWPQRSHVHEA